MRNHFASGSFLRGFGRVLDIRGSIQAPYARRAPRPVSDQAAIEADWEAVWSDLGIACDRVMAGSPRGAHGR